MQNGMPLLKIRHIFYFRCTFVFTKFYPLSNSSNEIYAVVDHAVLVNVLLAGNAGTQCTDLYLQGCAKKLHMYA